MNTQHDDEIDSDWTTNELLVLRSAELDLPPRGADQRALGALGIGAALGVAGMTLAKTPLAALSKGWWLKWLALAACGAGVVGAVLATRTPSKPRAHAAPAVLSAAPAAPVLPSNETASVPTPEALPSAPSLPPAPSSVLPATTADVREKPVVSNGLADEIRLIDEARQRLHSGDALGSLSTLDRYDQLLRGRGSMRDEATVVRIEALQASGARERAAALGQRFLSTKPGSPYAAYVQRLLAGSP